MDKEVKSDNVDVLCQSREIIDELLTNESERGKSVYSRTSILIALSGAILAVLLFFEEKIPSVSTAPTAPISIIYLVYFTIIIFILKAVYYSIKSIGISQFYCLSDDTIYEIQDKDILDSIRHEITEKIWVYNKMIPHNNHKLYYVNLGLRNLLFGISFIVSLGFMILLINKSILSFPDYFDCVGAILILFALFSDKILDRFSFWKFE